MGIDNNQLVARYFDRKADHAAFFKALEAYLDDQINELYTTLNDTFADTVTLSLDVAIAKAHQAGAKIQRLKKLRHLTIYSKNSLLAVCGCNHLIKPNRTPSSLN